MKILFSNIGYAKGIDGTLRQHLMFVHRYVFCPPSIQQQVISQFKEILQTEKPDLCCLVEIDEGSLHSAYFNQIAALIDKNYRFYDIADKYAYQQKYRFFSLQAGRCNAILANSPLPFERIYLKSGKKRLVYHIELPNGVALFFSHFSLQRRIRQKQFQEMRELVDQHPKGAIVMADFNIHFGFKELEPLVNGGDLRVLNKEDDHTFTFHKHKLALDLCICSKSIADKASLRIINQPFSDHQALLLEI